MTMSHNPPHDTARNDNNGSNRRRKYVIDPGFQWKYAALIAAVVFLISGLMSSLLYGMLHQQARLRAMSPSTYSAEVTLVLVGFGVAYAVVTAAGVGAWSLIMTHRICGPLFVLERFIRELGQGRIPNIRPLRKKDEFKALYATFTDTVEVLKAHKLADLATLTKVVERANAAADADETACREALRSLTSDVNAMRKALAEAVGAELPNSPRSPRSKPEGRPIALAVGEPNPQPLRVPHL